LNYLAHLYLSSDDPHLMAGNFFGDHMKGLIDKELPVGIQAGVAYHRFIDSYTDTHPKCREARELLFKDYRHFSGVLTDIFWDYFLAKNWAKYHSQDLKTFTENSYARLEPLLPYFSENAARMFYAMRKNNWLLQYQYIEGIAASFKGLSMRVRIANPLLGAEEALFKHEDELQGIFEIFFQELHGACKNYLSKHGH